MNLKNSTNAQKHRVGQLISLAQIQKTIRIYTTQMLPSARGGRLDIYKQKPSEEVMILRQEMKKQAVEQLAIIRRNTYLAVEQIAQDNGLTPTDLAKLVVGGRTDTLEKEMIKQLLNNAEADLLETYNKQLEAF